MFNESISYTRIFSSVVYQINYMTYWFITTRQLHHWKIEITTKHHCYPCRFRSLLKNKRHFKEQQQQQAFAWQLMLRHWRNSGLRPEMTVRAEVKRRARRDKYDTLSDWLSIGITNTDIRYIQHTDTVIHTLGDIGTVRGELGWEGEARGLFLETLLGGTECAFFSAGFGGVGCRFISTTFLNDKVWYMHVYS